MPRHRSVRPRVRVCIHLDEDLVWFFKFFLMSPTEGRMKRGFSGIIERLLLAERRRLISSNPEAPYARPRPQHSEGHHPIDGRPPTGDLDPDEVLDLDPRLNVE